MKVKIMNRKMVFAESFHARALALALRIDRIFLCRKLLVALAMTLGLSGLVFAQRPDHQQAGNTSHGGGTQSRSSQPLPYVGATTPAAVSLRIVIA